MTQSPPPNVAPADGTAAHHRLAADLAGSLHLADGLREILASEGVDPGEWHVDQTAIAGQRVRYELVAELAATLHTADGLQDVLTIEGQRQALVQDLASSLHLGAGLAAILGSDPDPRVAVWTGA